MLAAETTTSPAATEAHVCAAEPVNTGPRTSTTNRVEFDTARAAGHAGNVGFRGILAASHTTGHVESHGSRASGSGELGHSGQWEQLGHVENGWQ